MHMFIILISKLWLFIQKVNNIKTVLQYVMLNSSLVKLVI